MVLALCEPFTLLTEAIARHAGQLLGEAGSSATIDALVVAEAIGLQPSVVLTSDPDDLGRLLGARPGVLVERV
jgi:hypothetical protein